MNSIIHISKWQGWEKLEPLKNWPMFSSLDTDKFQKSKTFLLWVAFLEKFISDPLVYLVKSCCLIEHQVRFFNHLDLKTAKQL